MDNNYTLNDISLMTGYTTRTLRSYIKSGLLHGTCTNRKWTFTESNLCEFFSNNFVMEGIEIKCNAHIKQFIQSMKREQPAGCFIYDFPGSKEAVESVLQNVITYLNGNDDVIVKFSFYYRDSYKAGRFVFIGDLNQIDGVIKILNERKK